MTGKTVVHSDNGMCCSALKISQLLRQGKLKGMLLSERNQYTLYILWFQLHALLEKWNHTDRERISGCQGLREGRGWTDSAQGIFRAWNYSVWYYSGGFLPFTARVPKLMKCTPPGLTVSVNWVIMKPQWRLTADNQCTTLGVGWGKLLVGKAVCCGAGVVGGKISMPSLQCCCESKTV